MSSTVAKLCNRVILRMFGHTSGIAKLKKTMMQTQCISVTHTSTPIEKAQSEPDEATLFGFDIFFAFCVFVKNAEAENAQQQQNKKHFFSYFF